ncbi:MAG: chromophore lyase CpcT/CpeT [Rhodospirillaceae bacterium]|nr:chromophore lyase CpcT/CpeT [Rhodospirillaceae bacterium]
MRCFISTAVVAVLAGTPALAQDKTILDQDAARLAALWDGAYDNANQVNEQERAKIPEAGWESRRHKIFKKVDLPAFGPNVTYVEQYLGEPPTSVYRQRIYAHRADPANNRIITDIYAFKGKDAEKALGAHKDPAKLKGFSPANMDKLPDGCAVFWRPSAEGFLGEQFPDQCLTMAPGMNEKIRLSDKIVLTPVSLSTQTKFIREDGSVMQGNPLDLPEVSYKARPFSCFMIVRNPDQPNGYERYNDLAIHDQGGEFTVTTMHKEAMIINVWMLNLVTRNAGARPTLMLYAKEEGGKFERMGAFGSADASRLAVTASWGEANCTLVK